MHVDRQLACFSALCGAAFSSQELANRVSVICPLMLRVDAYGAHVGLLVYAMCSVRGRNGSGFCDPQLISSVYDVWQCD